MPRPFQYDVQGQLAAGGLALEALAAKHGTPLWVMDAESVRCACRSLRNVFAGLPVTLAYSVKANCTLAILRLIASEGLSFDIVSGGELQRVLRAGIDPRLVHFAGAGKTDEELRAAMAAGIGEFDVESWGELLRLQACAHEMGRPATVSLRINPGLAPGTHKYISTGGEATKFGLTPAEAARALGQRPDFANLVIDGIHLHIGSQILDTGSFIDAVGMVHHWMGEWRRHGPLRRVNLGGGFGIPYIPGTEAPDLAPLARALHMLQPGTEITFEPGRALVAAAGTLVTRVIDIKERPRHRFVVVDAAMNDLLRPALYGAHHEIIPLRRPEGGQSWRCDVVGPVCETGDFLATDREMARVAVGDLVAVLDAGAYGSSMSSNYNTRPRAAEILVDGGTHLLARRRETVDDLLRLEDPPPR